MADGASAEKKFEHCVAPPDNGSLEPIFSFIIINFIRIPLARDPPFLSAPPPDP